MRRSLQLLGGLVVLVLALGGSVAGDEVTMNGSFVWERHEEDNETGDLEAVFTPTGEGEWDVSFRFEWEDGDHTYTGTCSGSLSNGELTGAVKGDDDDHEMSFRFSGTFESGSFTGTHGYMNNEGELEQSGTLTLDSKG